MNKFFCDKCGKEIKSFDPFYKIGFTQTRNGLKSHHYHCEMCIECYTKLVDWLEMPPDAANPPESRQGGGNELNSAQIKYVTQILKSGKPATPEQLEQLAALGKGDETSPDAQN